MLVSHGSVVLAVDGGRMRLFRNRGKERSIELETIAERDLHNPATHVLSEPQPGRRFESNGSARSAYAATDTHQRREDDFCRKALDQALAAAGESGELILIAPAQVVGVLRKRIERRRHGPAVLEVVKDLTALPPHALGRRLRDLR